MIIWCLLIYLKWEEKAPGRGFWCLMNCKEMRSNKWLVIIKAISSLLRHFNPGCAMGESDKRPPLWLEVKEGRRRRRNAMVGPTNPPQNNLYHTLTHILHHLFTSSWSEEKIIIYLWVQPWALVSRPAVKTREGIIYPRHPIQHQQTGLYYQSIR